MRPHNEPDPYPRPCAADCGLTAAPGDIYCDGCRSGVDRARDLAEHTPRRWV